MLCRTASDLYWMSRHIERVDNTARLIDLARRIALLPERGRDGGGPWRRALDALGLADAYQKRHGAIAVEPVLRYLVLSADNPSSIWNCLRQARESARSQRGAITTEMYEDLNTAWLTLRDQGWEDIFNDGIAPFIDWLKSRSASFRGVTLGTMVRDEGYRFLRLGTFIERAEFGIRLLDVNFGESASGVPVEARSAAEYYQHSALLQSLSAFEAYRKTYRDSLTPARVAELLILRQDMPRSLAVCSRSLFDILSEMTDPRSTPEVLRLAGQLAAQIRFSRIDDIVALGMSRWLTEVMQQIHRIGDAITAEFMLSADAVPG